MFDPLSGEIEFPNVSAQPPRPPRPVRKLLQPTDTPGEYLLHLSYSSLSAHLECPRKAENRLVFSRQGARPATALQFGRLFHRCEELRLRHGYCQAVVEKQHEAIQQHYLLNPVPPDEYRHADRMVNLMFLYNQRYADPNSNLRDDWHDKILSVDDQPVIERAFKYPLCTIDVDDELPYPLHQLLPDVPETLSRPYVSKLHVILTGLIDVAVFESNVLWAVDHKTTSRGGKEFCEAFRLSLQTRLYTLVLKHLFPDFPVAGCILNGVIVRPPTKTGTGTDFERHYYSYSNDLLEDCRLSLVAAAEDLVHHLSSGFFPQYARSFISPCAHCDYQDNCALPFSQREADLQTDLYSDVEASTLGETEE